MDHENVANMKKGGVVIWLRAEPETIKNRILHDENTGDFRPALTAKGLIEEIEATLRYRNSYYEAAMGFSIFTDRLGLDKICTAITSKLSNLTAS